MPAIWSAEEIAQMGAADETTDRGPTSRRDSAEPGADLGRQRRHQVYVRTWYRRDNGWFGHVVDSARARIRVPGLEVNVVVEDVGNDIAPELRAGVDTAYRAKYGRYGAATVDRTVTNEAAATTLWLAPDPGDEGSKTGHIGQSQHAARYA